MMTARLMSWGLVAILGAMTAVLPAGAVETNYYYVSTNAPSSAPPFTSWETAATNIQDAVDQAQADFAPTTNCIVTVSNGLYVLTNQISITKAITVQSFSGSALTVVDANAASSTPRRCFAITAPAVLDGFTIRNGYTLGTSHTVGDPGGGVYMTTGTVQNCLIVSNKSTYYGGGVYIGGGVLFKCQVMSNSVPGTTRTGTGNDPDGGGGIFCGAAQVIGCLIQGNSAYTIGAPNSGGGGILLNGGLLALSAVQNNTMSVGWGGPGAFVTYYGGSVISNCTFSGNSGGGRALAVQLQSGSMLWCTITNHGNSFAVDTYNATTLRNTLIADNVGTAIRPWGGGRIENCTITRNSIGVDRQSGNPIVLVNTINYGNSSTSFLNSASPVYMTNCCSTTNGPGTFVSMDSISSNPLFNDIASKDYRLGLGSPCVNTGTNLSWIVEGVLDLRGAPRLVGPKVDMGVYEQPVIGAQTNIYYVSLTPGAQANTPPYDTWEKAATNIQLATDKAQADLDLGIDCLVIVTNGTYRLTNQIAIARGITLRSVEGRDLTIIDANASSNTPRRGVSITSSKALLDGFTIMNGYTLGTSHTVGDPGGGLFIDSATVKNCTIYSNRTTYYGGGVYMNQGSLLNCNVVSNSIPGSTRTGTSSEPDGGGGVFCNGGTVRSCLILGNVNGGPGPAFNSGGGGFNLYGGLIADSVIRLNTAPSAWGGGGGMIGGAGGTVSNCVFSANTGNRAAGCQMAAGTMVNCVLTNHTGSWVIDTGNPVTIRNTLIANNSGIVIRPWSGGAIENCTFVRNTYGIDRQSGTALAFVNSINTSNTTADFYTGASATLGIYMTNSCCPTLTGAGNFFATNCITGNPKFVAPAASDFQLGKGSPCINAGILLSWITADAIDLAGGKRVKGIRVDMGAYEAPPPAGTVMQVR
jgi:hypothetical protein